MISDDIPKEKIHKFGKQLFTSFITSECDRKLFLTLSRKNEKIWMNPVREVTPGERPIRSPSYLAHLGKKYEKSIYQYLIHQNIENTSLRISNAWPGHVTLTKNVLEGIHRRIVQNQYKIKILIEYEFFLPFNYFAQLFQLRDPTAKIPVDYGSIRPDILVIGNEQFNQENIKEISADGTILSVNQSTLQNRIGISIIDVKNIKDEKIGKKQFIEILFYAITLANYLQYLELDTKFFICIDKNGILPHIETLNAHTITNIQEFHDIIIPIKWEESYMLYSTVIDRIKDMWKKVPCPIESNEVNIQPTCGQCSFLEDCKNTLYKNSLDDPAKWSLELIPYTSRSIAKQLKSLGFNTIEDVYNNIDSIQIGNIPEPIFPELPMLKLKAKSLIKNEICFPSAGEIHSSLLPKYTPISLVFAIESDPSNERVFAAGFLLTMSVNAKSPYILSFDNWWKTWKSSLDTNITPEEIQDELNSTIGHLVNIEEIKTFQKILKNISNFNIYLPGTIHNNAVIPHTKILYQFRHINTSLDDADEFEMVKKIISALYAIITICNTVENNVIVLAEKKDTYYTPDTGIFYWSEEQLSNLKELFERNLQLILQDSLMTKEFEELFSWFNPADSEVSHPYQHKKIYNLQNFAETSFGFPKIINYTWHEIAEKLFPLKQPYSKLFWISHYNYMDFTAWHEYLLHKEENEYISARLLTDLKPKLKAKFQKKKEKLELQIPKNFDDLNKQILNKLRALNSLRTRFQHDASRQISKFSRPFKFQDFQQISLDDDYHAISHVWYFFSKLDGTLDELEKDEIRNTFPDYSIGKLNAARVTNLEVFPMLKKKYMYMFNIVGLSSNIKLSEGDRILLIPNEKRDMKFGPWTYNWEVEIDEMIWDAAIKGYKVITLPKSVNLLELYEIEIEIKDNPPVWYLYPYSIDAWSKKLYNDKKSGLLQQHKFGNSWLGHRLAMIWEIRAQHNLLLPRSWHFSAPELYMFCSDIIKDTQETTYHFPLKTNIFPTPNPSQQKTIIQSLNHIVFAIKGPPGTGKSQTIAALIDEYLVNKNLIENETPTRILVTAFSYSAIRVLIDKIRKSKNKYNKPTCSATTQMVFIRSGTQNSIPEMEGLKSVEDLVRSASSWKWNGESKKITKNHLLEEQLENNVIIFANAHQLYYLVERVSADFYFDLIIADEASQLPTDQILSSLQFLKNATFHLGLRNETLNQDNSAEKLTVNEITSLIQKNPINPSNLTKLIIVGDYNQLPPVQRIDPPKNLIKILDSLFSYYLEYHNIDFAQLKVNYRSHNDIVQFTSELGIYDTLTAYLSNASRLLSGNISLITTPWVADFLNPQKVVCAIIHKHQFEIAISSIEANIITKLIIGYYLMIHPENEEEEIEFWKEKIGVVAPHNAQGRMIILKTFQALTNGDIPQTQLSNQHLMKLLKTSIYSVEKFQGSDRELIIASFGLSDRDQLKAESEFIFNLNRFNVLTSRAKWKMITVCSEEFLKYIPSDRNIMDQAAQIRKYILHYCNKNQFYSVDLEDTNENIEFRWKE